jgi:hypothetical protein
MAKITGAIMLAFPFMYDNAQWVLAQFGINSMALALAMALWFAIGAFADMCRAFLAMGPKPRRVAVPLVLHTHRKGRAMLWKQIKDTLVFVVLVTIVLTIVNVVPLLAAHVQGD